MPVSQVFGSLGVLGPVVPPYQGNTPFGSPYGPAMVNPMLAAQGREGMFNRGIRTSPWFSEFVKEYGEKPDLRRGGDYNYRAAWQAGVRPERDPYDGNRLHWPSSTHAGQMLKSDDHPTAWKEHYMRATGNNPDAVGATQNDFLRIKALADILGLGK